MTTTQQQQDAFRALVEEHRKILHKICHAYCRDAATREDLAQEILVQLWRSFGKFDGRAKFSTWMYRIALNVAISFYRSESSRTRRIFADEQTLLDAAAPEGQPEEIRLLYQFIGALDEMHKALLLLYLDGNSYREIGDVLGITETNAATRVGRLKDRMREEFGESRKR